MTSEAILTRQPRSLISPETKRAPNPLQAKSYNKLILLMFYGAPGRI